MPGAIAPELAAGSSFDSVELLVFASASRSGNGGNANEETKELKANKLGTQPFWRVFSSSFCRNHPALFETDPRIPVVFQFHLPIRSAGVSFLDFFSFFTFLASFFFLSGGCQVNTKKKQAPALQPGLLVIHPRHTRNAPWPSLSQAACGHKPWHCDSPSPNIFNQGSSYLVHRAAVSPPQPNYLQSKPWPPKSRFSSHKSIQILPVTSISPSKSRCLPCFP